MWAILALVLHIFLLLLKAHFAKETDASPARRSLEEAQLRFTEAAQSLELKLRYEHSKPTEMDQFQDAIDQERCNHETPPHG